MLDSPHLDAFVEQQTDPICLALGRRFLSICRDPGVSSAEYSTRIREAMDELLREANVPTDSVGA
jgi:hypothetical protein